MAEMHFQDLITAEELAAHDAFVAGVNGDSEAGVTVTYNYKTSESMDYDTGVVTPAGPGSEDVNGLVASFGQTELEDLNIEDGDLIVLIQKSALDAVSVTPEMWDDCEIDSITYYVKGIELPMARLHYRIHLGVQGRPIAS